MNVVELSAGGEIGHFENRHGGETHHLEAGRNDKGSAQHR
jgi:hypothetical protein